MASLNLTIDTTNDALLAGYYAPITIDPQSLPFYFGDTISLKVQLLNKTNTTLAGSNPYTIINTAGLQLFMFLTDGKIGGTIYTQQISWNTDPTFSYFFSTLSLNTLALQTLLGMNTSATCWLQIGYVQNGLPVTVFSQQIVISVGIPATNLVVPAGLTPLSAEVANAMFVHLDGNPNNPGQGFFLVTPNGKKLFICAADNPDGTAVFQANPVN